MGAGKTNFNTIVFNGNNFSGDLDNGSTLPANILFVQNNITPSQHQLVGDIQPHLVAHRKTMVLCSPQINIGEALPISMSVENKDRQIIANFVMKQPTALTAVAERIAGSKVSEGNLEEEFSEPDHYDKVITDPAEFDRMKDDIPGVYLGQQFGNNSTIKIHTYNGGWISNFYLPAGARLDGKVLLFFSEAGSKSNIYYSGKTFELQLGMTLLLRNYNGVWYSMDEARDAVGNFVNMDESYFSDPGNYDLTIADQATLNRMKDDFSGDYLNTQFNSHNAVEIQTYDGAWIKDFYLPTNAGLEGKIVKFTADAGYSSLIHCSGKSYELQRGVTTLLRYYRGVWYSQDDLAYSQITYSNRYWSAILPPEIVQPGITLHFEHGGRHGTLSNINIGAPNELVIHTIDLGMLTPPRNEFTFQKDPELHRQYFQQIPVSRLIVTQYESQHFLEVMLPDGTLLTDHDPSVGDAYSGTMRQRIAKELVSIGINNANYGIHSSRGQGESDNPYSVAQITAHNAVGKYANNTIVVHGQSGGAGMATLGESIGNEFSHEIGHNYGLDHNFTHFEEAVHRPADQINSTWGWDGDHDFFIPNFEKRIGHDETCLDISGTQQCQAPFEGHTFGLDAMAGGRPFYQASNQFTLYTPNSVKKIQTFFESKAVFDENSPTGFSKWNANTQSMAPWENSSDNFSIAIAKPDEVSLEGMTRLLSQFDKVKINFYDGFYNSQIYIPTASVENKGKIIHVKHEASNASNMHINGLTVPLRNGDEMFFLSADGEWKNIDKLASTKPYKQGVVVVTLIGYYDPQGTLTSYIYPALHGAFGMVYEPDSNEVATASACYLQVDMKNGDTQYYKLATNRIDSSCMNKFHVNIEEALSPVRASIVRHGTRLAAIAIDKPKETLIYTVNGTPHSPLVPDSQALKLQYRRHAAESVILSEGLAIGNGRMGGLVSGDPAQEVVYLNEISLWSGGKQQIAYEGDYEGNPELVSTLMGSYLTLGQLRIELNGHSQVSGYQRELDISNAIVRTQYQLGAALYRREVFCSAHDDAMVIRLSSDEGRYQGAVSLVDGQGTATSGAGSTLSFSGSVNGSGELYAVHLRVIPEAGTVALSSTGEKRILFQDCRALTIILSARTNYSGKAGDQYLSTRIDPNRTAEAEMNAAAAQTYSTLLGNHVRDYRALFDRFELNLGVSSEAQRAMAMPERLQARRANGGTADPELDALFIQFGRYLTIASSRDRLPANLQGLWNITNQPGWSSDYHSDVNLQMNYWLADQTALPECQKPFADYLIEQYPAWSFLTQSHFNDDINPFKNSSGRVAGWTAMYSSGIYGSLGWRWHPASGAWYCRTLWNHYQYTLDRAYLNRIYPPLKAACAFWQARLVTDPQTNTLLDDQDWSPEQGGYARGNTYAQELVWDLFTNYISASRILNRDADYASTIANLKAQLYLPQVSATTGKLQEWKDDAITTNEPKHRHLSPLIGWYEGERIFDDPPLEAGVRALLTERTFGQPPDMQSTYNGEAWSIAWRIACWARFKEAPISYSLVSRLFDHISLNMFDGDAGFQIDGNFGAPSAMLDMLMHGWIDLLVLLPALPPQWGSGQVKGLRAKGGFALDMSWSANALTAITLYSLGGTHTTLQYGSIERGVTVPLNGSVTLDGNLN
ncbi:glycosyl hydrolase family 95 catalytic domain-containing protein [Paludibacterium purpuratum]|uniref:Glycosyl hydrolase family 65 n=1 Tax=Paludibacterium purpuratum TaxID=1144873 RepID=A0A4R7B4T9_9NEIS|nr:M66 family metalloprotease [Paludibacterium purpuratum]TDR79654.1 glycosyl hydrolase family 65 [Paludibacterium purpuratum]